MAAALFRVLQSGADIPPISSGDRVVGPVVWREICCLRHVSFYFLLHRHEGNREHQMSKRKKGRERPEMTGERNDGETLEVWLKEKPSRHKWFRKRKKGGGARRPRFDDEIDEEAGKKGKGRRRGRFV